MWAAEGLAQTCYLTYADSATGLGPDEMQMDMGYEGQDNEPYLWIDAVDDWTKTGRKGEVPGLSNKKPVYYTEDERLRGTGRGRDYVMRRTVYLLRPEVKKFCLMSPIDSILFDRQWNRYSSFGRPPGTPNGNNGDGIFSKPLKVIRRLILDTRFSKTWMRNLRLLETSCLGGSTFS